MVLRLSKSLPKKKEKIGRHPKTIYVCVFTPQKPIRRSGWE